MLQRVRRGNPVVLLIDEVIRLNSRLRSIFAGVGASTGLAPMETMVLTAVVESRAAPTVPQIGRSLGHARQVVQRAANDLIAAQLIKTAPNPNHKRAPLLLATAAGRNLKRDADRRGLKAANALLRVVNAEKCENRSEERRV